MNIVEYLQSNDPCVKRITQKYLLDEEPDYVEDGWISKFLDCFDAEKGMWGNGIYGPKWISTFYTMRDLASLEIRPDHPIYQRGLDTLVSNMWSTEWREDDICVVAMLISLLSYGNRDSAIIDEMVLYLLNTRQNDGGWNCASTRNPKATEKSSINTTLSVLEAFRDYEKYGYKTHLSSINNILAPAHKYLLDRHLMFRLTDGEVIISYIIDFHFPTRWKYDVLRALCYFASIDYKLVPEMSEGLTLLKEKFKRGYLIKGPTYSGKQHFKMETGKIGNMNTIRGLIVLKSFEPEEYHRIISREITP